MTQDKTHVSVDGFDVRVPDGGVGLNVMHELPKQSAPDGNPGAGQADKEETDLRPGMHAPVGEFEVHIPCGGAEPDVVHVSPKQGSSDKRLSQSKTASADASTWTGQVDGGQADLRQGIHSSVGGVEAQYGGFGSEQNVPTGIPKGDTTEPPHARADSNDRANTKREDSRSFSFPGSRPSGKRKSVSFTMTSGAGEANSKHSVKKALSSEMFRELAKTEEAVFVPLHLDPLHFTDVKIPTDLDPENFVRMQVPTDLDPTYFVTKILDKKLTENKKQEDTMATDGKAPDQIFETFPGKEDPGNLAQPSGGSTSGNMNDMHSDLANDRNANKLAETTSSFHTHRHTVIERGKKQASRASIHDRRGSKNANPQELLPDKPRSTQDVTTTYAGLKDSLGHKSRFFMIKVDSTGKVHSTPLG